MAHVRAIGQVVGSESSSQQLPKKSCLVTRPSRSIEYRLVGIIKAGQLVRDDIESLVPRQFRVVISPRSEYHRVGQPSLRIQPPVRFEGEFPNRPLGPEFRSSSLSGSLVCDSLSSVLTELRYGSMSIGIGPRATRAVKAIEAIYTGEVPEGR